MTCAAKTTNGCFCKRHALADVSVEAVNNDDSEMNSVGEGLKTRKIRVRPTPFQRQTIRQWFGVARKYYNKAIEVLSNVENKHLGTSLANVRPVVFDELNSLEYCQQTPEKIRQGAVADACKAVSNAKRKYKQTGRFQCCKFRCKKQSSQSVYIISTGVKETQVGKEVQIHEKVGHLGGLKTFEKLPETSASNYRLTMENFKFFYLCVAVPLKDVRQKYRGKKNEVVALDPGVRSFQTFVSQNDCGSLQQNDEKMGRLHSQQDNLRAKIQRLKNHRLGPQTSPQMKDWLRGRISKLRAHFRTLYSRQSRVVTEMHRKMTNYLLQKYDIVLLPNFQSGRLKEATKAAKVNRSYDTYAHYKFREYMHFKAQEYGARVYAAPESYTSKTCSSCGTINSELGSSRTFGCICGLDVNRDLNGAKNVCLKNVR